MIYIFKPFETTDEHKVHTVLIQDNF